METIALTKLLASIHVECADDRIVAGISDDSRQIARNWLFICRKGTQADGAQFIAEVLAKGGIVLWENEDAKDCYHTDDITKALPILLNVFYDHPDRHLCVIGVTGTNGKTSVTMILYQLLKQLNRKAMVIGTNHIRYLDKDIAIDNTTPSACMLAEYFARARNLDIPYILMEVSSHAIDQKRIGAIRFDFVLYTNIASDHLDYHITHSHYMYTKFKLRKYLKRHGVMILNHDLVELHPLYHLADHKIITFGITQAHLRLTKIEYRVDGASFVLEDTPYDMQMLGQMNVYNVAEALVVLHRLYIPMKSRQQAVAHLASVAGRMEVLRIKDAFVWIDYAHTQSALEALLALAQQVKQTRILCIVGCGGDRDRSKRSEMAFTALRYSDLAIFTADNPRGEAVEDILMDMLQGNNGNYEIFENRACAVKYAMNLAQNHDIIILAGKGDENWQIIQGKKYPLNDRELVESYRRMEEQDL